jgi:hypothetical protein
MTSFHLPNLALFTHRTALKVDVLLVPHHGSRTSSTPPFIAAVAAPTAVCTPGCRNRFGHPRPDGVPVYGLPPITVAVDPKAALARIEQEERLARVEADPPRRTATGPEQHARRAIVALHAPRP